MIVIGTCNFETVDTHSSRQRDELTSARDGPRALVTDERALSSLIEVQLQCVKQLRFVSGAERSDKPAVWDLDGRGGCDGSAAAALA